MLTFENISFYRNEKKIFSNLGFSLFLGSALVIRGKNGCGKTSLLRIIAGISKEYSGNILWDGENIKNFYDDFCGDLQFIGHKNFLKPELTIEENLSFYAKLNDSEMLVESALKFFKLQEIAKQKIKNLSAGLKQKALLAKLLACPATIWILDEPSTNLDEESKKLLVGLIETKLENQGIVIIATHDEIFSKFGKAINLEDFC